jgi:hypothetical protein
MVFLTRSLPISGLFLSAGRHGRKSSEEISLRLALIESFCVVEDHPDCVTAAGAQAADAVAQIDPINTARTVDRTVVDGEDHRIALAQWDDFGTGLHARPLLGDDELTAGESPLPKPCRLMITRLRKRRSSG